jgi:hypothetical protein
MTRIWISGTLAAALGCAATLSAQASATTQGGAPAAVQQPGGDAHRTVTVVGCVQNGAGTTGATGTTGVARTGASAAATPSGWILANASTAAPGAESAATANTAPNSNREAGAGNGTATAGAVPVPAGSGGGANRGMSGSTYLLEPGSQDMSAHAGHKVEITGTLAGMPASSTAAANTADPARATSSAAQTTANASGPVGQRLRVSSVKMISANCS